ncbi:MAG: hypothetical protein ABSD97_15970 [Acidimicrobiales bacterium]|jgi:hypothetical protein
MIIETLGGVAAVTAGDSPLSVSTDFPDIVEPMHYKLARCDLRR